MMENNNSISNLEDGILVSNKYQPPPPPPPPPPQKKPFCQRCRRLLHATTGLIFFCYITAYTLQNSLVINYIEENLLHKYNVNSCEPLNVTNEGNEAEEEEDSPGEKCEQEFKEWNLYLTLVSVVPAFILAPFVASWSDSIHRLVPMYISIAGIIVSSIAIPLAIILEASNEIVTFCLYPACLTGGVVVLTVIVFGFEADIRNGFKIFERYLELTAANVTASAVCQLVLTTLYNTTGSVVNDYVIWVPIVCIVLGLVQMYFRSPRIRDSRREIEPDQILCLKIVPVNFYRLFKCPQGIYVFMLFVCAFSYYFLYVGETLEVIEILDENEPWQISSFSKQGAVQDVASTVTLFICVFFSQKFVEKRIVDARVVPKLSLSYVALLALALDFVTKLIVSFVQGDVQLWVPTIGIICELAIIVIRYLAVLLVPKGDAAKSLSLLAWAQLIAVFPAPLFVQAVHEWTETFWSNFIYIFMGLLLLIPSLLLWIVGKFGPLPLPEMKHRKEEGEEEPKPRSGRLRQLFKLTTKTGYDTSV